MKRNVLITGVSGGMGRAIAEEFLNHGYTVFGTFCSSRDRAQELIEIYGKDRVCILGPYDFTNLSSTRELLQSLEGISFNAIICNAGFFSGNDDFNNFCLEEFERIMRCNFYSPLILTIGLKNQIASNGSIVIVSSNDAYSGAYLSISYSVSKAALLSLMKCLSVNYGTRGVRVNAVTPGAINTDMNTPEQIKIAPYFTPVSRVGKPEDVSKVIYFLASEANFISGDDITIDGGFHNVSILLKSEADNALSKGLMDFIQHNSSS